MCGIRSMVFLLGALAASAAAASDLAGVIRIRGSDEVAGLLGIWERAFREIHPDVAFEATLKGNESAMIGLEENVADVVLMTRQIVPYDTYGIWRRAHRMPIEVVVGTGSFDARRKAHALTVFVHADNPIRGLTLAQLDGIFGAQRSGGWNGMEWDPSAARGEGADLRTWGQLGATGEWADKPIHPYGPPATFPGGMSYFQIRVMHGADSRAEGLREYADDARMVDAMASDRYAIGYASMAARTPAVKSVAIAEREGAPFVAPSRQSVRDGSYPLSRSIYAYLAPDAPTGERRHPAIEPRVREFLRYVLSDAGRQAVEREGDFLPLSASAALAQRERLEAIR